MSLLEVAGVAVAIVLICCAVTSVLYERGMRKIVRQTEDKEAQDPRAGRNEC